MNKKNFNDFTEELIAKAKKFKGQYPPISEAVNNEIKLLKIKNIYKIEEKSVILYLFKIKNYTKNSKYRYFIGNVIASQSSDLLVNLAKNYAINNSIKLIQFCLHPNTHRINLLSLIELKTVELYPEILDHFSKLNIKFKEKLKNLNNILENK